MTRFKISRIDGENFHSRVRFNFYLLTKRDITADSIYRRALDFLGELSDLGIVNVSDQIEISSGTFNRPRLVTKPYIGDNFRSYAMSKYLEDIFKTHFHGIAANLVDMPKNNDTDELRRVILESKHVAPDLSDWTYNYGCPKVSITLDIEHEYMLRRKGVEEINLIEYTSDNREDHNKSKPSTKCYVVDKITGAEKRVDDLALEVPVDKSQITEQLNQVKRNFPDSYISSIDFISDDLPENLVISEYSCKDMNNSYWASDDTYLWLTTFDAARSLINDYCSNHRGCKVVLRLKKK